MEQARRAVRYHGHTLLAFDPQQLVALIVAACFAAGLNVYATLATLGVLGRTGWVTLPAGLHAVTDTWVIAVACSLFAVEFFADKIPVFDVAWNAAHTFIRIPLATLLAYQASAQLSPTHRLLATLLGAGIAAIAHSSKTTARILVTPSPEPVSNIALSTAEDGAAIGLTWFATHHPFAAAGISIVALILIVASARWIFVRIDAALTRWRGQALQRLGISK